MAKSVKSPIGQSFFLSFGGVVGGGGGKVGLKGEMV